MELNFDNTTNAQFPSRFKVQFLSIDDKFREFAIIKNDKYHPIGSADVYTVDSANNVVKFDHKNVEVVEN